MKLGSKSTGKASGSPPTGAEINNRNWGEVFGAAVRAKGGMGFVIRNEEPKVAGPATPSEWRAWMIYFEDHGISTKFIREYGISTVPTQWPEEFEAGAATGRRTRSPASRWPWRPSPAPQGDQRGGELKFTLRLPC